MLLVKVPLKCQRGWVAWIVTLATLLAQGQALRSNLVNSPQQSVRKLSGVGLRAGEIDWESQKIVLPPVSRNPNLNIPPDLRNKPPSVHVNFYPDITTTRPPLTTKPTINRRFYQVTTRRPYYPTPSSTYFDSEPRPNSIDLEVRPSYNRRNEEKINLNTDYFIKKGDAFLPLVPPRPPSTPPTTVKQVITTRRKRRLTTLKPSRIPILVKKIAKRPVSKSPGNGAKVPKKTGIVKQSDLCKGVLECSNVIGGKKGSKVANTGPDNRNGTGKNYVVSWKKNELEGSIFYFLSRGPTNQFLNQSGDYK